MQHVMRAEYAEGTSPRKANAPVKTWHMVRDADAIAMCGRELDPQAATRPDDEWGQTEEPFCHSCGAVYLREVP